MPLVSSLCVAGNHRVDTSDLISSKFTYSHTSIAVENGQARIEARPMNLQFNCVKTVPKTGLLIVGLSGNNGSTITGAYFANKHKLQWETPRGVQSANWYGSLMQCGTSILGNSSDGPVSIRFADMLPTLNPDDLVVGGWDISSFNLYKSMKRAQVFPIALQEQLKPYMEPITPLKAAFLPDFVASNQSQRADNVLTGDRSELVNQLRDQIRTFKTDNALDKVIVLWSANTERTVDIEDCHLTSSTILDAIKNNDSRISASVLYAIASIQEGCAFINGSPQNTLLPGIVELAAEYKVYIAGDDFKTGQTKIKSVLVDFLVGAGIKPRSIVSYNHLGNNDGFNLSAPQQFRSKELSKSNVIDDAVLGNPVLYPNPKEDHPDHTVVIKYQPFVGDSKRAMDEYISELMCGGFNTIVLHNTCEDSILAAPLMLDLVLFTELLQRITVKVEDGEDLGFDSLLSLLSFFLKAPCVPDRAPVINTLWRQRLALDNFMRIVAGLPLDTCLSLEDRIPME
ncbi:hypothetical protein RCL1_005971 [Eukaryota sp. TZLM3-RCL]